MNNKEQFDKLDMLLRVRSECKSYKANPTSVGGIHHTEVDLTSPIVVECDKQILKLIENLK